MRRLLTWVVVTLGIAALVRRLRRRRETTDVAPAVTSPDPADELRRKLDETRAAGPASAEEAPAQPSATVEERRASVHEEGRSALDEMRRPDEG